MGHGHIHTNLLIYKQMRKIFDKLPDETRAFFVVKKGPIEDLYSDD